MHVLRQICQAIKGDGILAHKVKYSMVQLGCLLVHIILFFVFLALKVYPMVIFNMASIVCYIVCGRHIAREEYKFFYYISCIEIMLHSFMATIMVGWDYGFSMYIIAIVPVMFYMHFTLDGDSTVKQSLVLGICAAFCFILCRFFSFTMEPLYETSQAVSVAMYVFNTICAFVMINMFCTIFIVEIKASHAVLAEQNAELNQMASVDTLTGLLNRRSMSKFLARAMESGNTFSVIMCDIDDFKRINDTYGHECGDIVLKEISNTIRDSLRDVDFVCRWGGEEILILASKTPIAGAVLVAERIRHKIEQLCIEYGGSSVKCTITLGAAEYSGEKKIEDLLNIADGRLYKGKKNGKNCVTYE